MLVIKQEIENIWKGLESWDWIDFSGMEPFITTCFGDVFFESSDGIYFLDTLGGSLEKVASSKEEMQEILNTEDGQDHFLMSGLAIAAQENGMNINEGECLDFKISPALGGELTLENINVMPFVVSLDIAGQIMKQIKDLPPGTKIDKVTLDDA